MSTAVEYKSTKNLISLGQFLKDGGAVKVGMKVVFEKTLRTHIPAIMQDFNIVLTEYNAMTMGRLCENTCTLYTDDSQIIEKVPFSMLYLEKEYAEGQITLETFALGKLIDVKIKQTHAGKAILFAKPVKQITEDQIIVLYHKLRNL